MIVKRFLADNMQDAMRKISEEMGPEAVILEQKFVRRKGITGYFKKKQVQVVAAYDPYRPISQDSNKENAQKAEATPAHKEEGTFGSEQAKQLLEIKELVKQLTEKSRIAAEAEPRYSLEVQRIYKSLVERDVSEELAKEIADKAQAITAQKVLDARAVARQLVLDRLGEPYPLKLKKLEQNVLLFAGSTGAGKTTTVAKLAGMLKFTANLRVGIVNTDTYRIGAMEHIRIFADLMEIPLIMAYSEEDVETAIKTLADRDVVLVDTAGKSARDREYQKELGGLIKLTKASEVFLVLSVSTSKKSCKELIENYSFIEDYKLIITKLDEIEFPGNVLNIVEYSKKRLAYVTVGQNVPEDIREADTQKLAGSIIGDNSPH